MELFIQHLYKTFARYAKPRDFPACQCCLSGAEKTILLNHRLKDLGADELTRYASDLFLTVGSLADFKYFLPRILELSVRGELSWPSPEVVFGKLPKADWENWPEVERDAIVELLHKKLEALLKDPLSEGSSIDTWVCALGQCLPDMTLYLDRMLEDNHAEKLASFVELNLSAYSENKLSNPFWESAQAGERHVLAWMKKPGVTGMLTERYGMRF